jgi:hypothetical protein
VAALPYPDPRQTYNPFRQTLKTTPFGYDDGE